MSAAKKSTHGGARKGAGRPRKFGSLLPKDVSPGAVTTHAINLPPELWAMLDRLRGSMDESTWFAGAILRADAAASTTAPVRFRDAIRKGD